jgi:hypothetical protein
MWQDAIQDLFGKDLIVEDNAVAVSSIGVKGLTSTSDVEHRLFPTGGGLCHIQEIIAFCWSEEVVDEEGEQPCILGYFSLGEVDEL